ncbi:hypothetical protein SK355_08945 [Candidatus Fukatsuia symbiotica]|uniref:Uncharacterized protein n=1 Tax=Candidatus Fukatsuia symbiotica TaxID=1878942 RepID=A0A2U8I374_9GAMM|nr:hypothetical protein [Candidatus Fukatsuia symbiotica]AWK13570.1 hypothetical protein CCS41_02100 [Candidatus Fukatsuia symbiotica]MEA9445359.1 hypothetical protein [Candidatus Fukatsuia symbiotica]
MTDIVFSVGTGYFPTTVRIEEILNDDRHIYMTLWEKIKEFFFFHGHKEAQECLKKLCHPVHNITLDEVEKILFKLKELASPAYKERFCYDFGSTDNLLQMKDNRGNDIFSININKNDKIFSYTILDKEFFFYDPTIEFRDLVDDFRTRPALSNGLSIATKGTKLSIAYKDGNSLRLDFGTIYKDIMKMIREINPGEYYKQWLEQEKCTYLCALINLQIDRAFMGHKQLTKNERLSLFKETMHYLNKSDMTIDIACAQGSIKHLVSTYLMKNTLFTDFLKRINDCDQKSEVNTKISYALSDLMYESIFKENIISSVRKTAAHVANEYIQRAA